MTEPEIGTGMSDIKVASNVTPSATPATTGTAPIEQKSTETRRGSKETVSTEPRTLPKETTVEVSGEASPEAALTPSVTDDAGELSAARRFLDDGVRRFQPAPQQPTAQASQPSAKVPDINDQSTWGDKYKNAANDLETYHKARDEWVEAQAEKKFTEKSNKETAQKRQDDRTKLVINKMGESRKKNADFDSIVQPYAPYFENIPLLSDFLVNNPHGTDVMYELCKNHKVFKKLLESNDVWSAGQTLLSMAERVSKPPAPEITQAPEPIKPIGSRETAPTKLEQLASKNTAQYIKIMNQRELKARQIH